MNKEDIYRARFEAEQTEAHERSKAIERAYRAAPVNSRERYYLGRALAEVSRTRWAMAQEAR